MKKQEQDTVIKIATLVAAYFFIAVPILEKLGIKKSATTKDIDEAISDPNSIWQGKYWQGKPSAKLIKVSGVQQFWKELNDCFGWFGDDEQAVYATFKKYITSKTQLSWVAYILARDYKIDLLPWLQGDAYPNDRLSDNEIGVLMQWANNLPKGY